MAKLAQLETQIKQACNGNGKIGISQEDMRSIGNGEFGTTETRNNFSVSGPSPAHLALASSSFLPFTVSSAHLSLSPVLPCTPFLCPPSSPSLRFSLSCLLLSPTCPYLGFPSLQNFSFLQINALNRTTFQKFARGLVKNAERPVEHGLESGVKS